MNVPQIRRNTRISVLFAVFLLGAGVAGGWLLRGQGGQRETEQHLGEEEQDAHAEQGEGLSQQTLGNLGVELDEAKLSDFLLTREVPAVVDWRPGAVRPVHAPFPGRVLRVLVDPGRKVQRGGTVAEVLRDPFPRATLTLTGDLLRPLNEEAHSAVAELRTGAEALALCREELARIRKILGEVGSGGTTLPAKAEIDLVYEERRALRALENARYEAQRHGFTAEEIALVEQGGRLPQDLPLAQRVLERNHLWPAGAAALLESLPPDLRGLPYTLAILGELSATGSISARLVEAVRARPPLAAAFLDVAGLLQAGWSVAALEALDDAGALGPVVPVRLPADLPDADVGSVLLRPGAQVQEGVALLECVDARRVALRMSPSGADLAALASALKEGAVLDAVPLIAGSAPDLANVRLLRLASSSSPSASAEAIAEAENTLLAEVAEPDGGVSRTWALRPGLRYSVRVPAGRLPGRFVLPAEAVTSRGPDSIVLRSEGEHFHAVPVRVEYADSRVAVVADDGAIREGDRIVVRGAFALSLALQAAKGGGADPHAGHGH